MKHQAVHKHTTLGDFHLSPVATPKANVLAENQSLYEANILNCQVIILEL